MLTTMILIMSWWEPVQVLEGLSGIWLTVEHFSQKLWIICRLLLTCEHFESVLCCEGGMDVSSYSVFLSFFKIHVGVSHHTILHTCVIYKKAKQRKPLRVTHNNTKMFFNKYIKYIYEKLHKSIFIKCDTFYILLDHKGEKRKSATQY